MMACRWALRLTPSHLSGGKDVCWSALTCEDLIGLAQHDHRQANRDPGVVCKIMLGRAFWTVSIVLSAQPPLKNEQMVGSGPRIEPVVLAAYPHTDLSGSGLAALSIVGSNDGIVRYGNYEGSRALLPENARERVIEGGNHAGFGDYGAQLGDMEATIASDEQQAISTDEIASLIDDLL